MNEPPSVDERTYFGVLLDHVAEAIVACDANWRVMAWNESARRIFGWTAEGLSDGPGRSSGWTRATGSAWTAGDTWLIMATGAGRSR